MAGFTIGGYGGNSQYAPRRTQTNTPRYGNSSNQVGKTTTPKKKKKTGAGIEVSPSNAVKSRFGV